MPRVALTTAQKEAARVAREQARADEGILIDVNQVLDSTRESLGQMAVEITKRVFDQEGEYERYLAWLPGYLERRNQQAEKRDAR